MFALERRRREIFFVLAVFFLFLLVNPVEANPRYASIVIDENTNQVLHEFRADASRYPASLTKMMTLYLLFEAMKQGKMTLDSRMEVSTHAASMPQTNISLRRGDAISVREAILALIVRSANDVAAVVAEALGDTEANFARMMTDKARKLGMHATTFRNASGLPNGEQKTTARDMATLSARLMKDFPQHYHYFSTQSFSYKGTTYKSHNRMVRNTPGVDGLKTGYIRASGFNMATSAKRGNRRVIAVVMGGQTGTSRDQHMAELLDRSFTARSTAIQLARNTGSANTMPAVAMKIDTPAPVPKPTLLSENIPDEPVIIERIVQPEISIEPQDRAVEDNNDWAVQIGSYLVQDRAEARAQAATRWVPGEVMVTEVEISNRKLYRARLVGFEEKQARKACRNLTRQGIECLVVRSHG
ncbi:D-alanyl-D-alanine carboxypeptidase [Nitrosomonas cryotolerans]|uniref:D-alanyl-D-alanine carboxypeptidase n=1 Tax=Nitrosomonas cryotolerans ATCC 49181 TaxID=1131553 RepID=A0A1N6GDA2_9PROT|nr:D-alanyl-D-alanine carboxypeptidase [Nitrosomonas cryotolerans]SFP88556.1 D-alanyl-D-alanine carboxypeptidase [Nitrosomonas cryotolerans]SIO05464.1 D-alanyl-D-alanine carboxypeptidase [Nitrosomonas cryotolerans ATCC 49181]